MASSKSFAMNIDGNSFTGLLNRFEQRLMGSVRSPNAANLSFGVARARQFTPKQKVSPAVGLIQEVGFSIVEVRERIKEFIEGTFKPDMLPDLLAYLSDRMLQIETRRSRDGNVANYLVDLKTNERILASSVDARLSRPGIAKLFGRTLESEAEVRKDLASVPPEVARWRAIRNENAGRLLGGDGPSIPFRDWDDMVFSSPAMFGGREIAQQGNQIWCGEVYVLASEDGEEVYARASEDAEENLAMLRKAKADGIELVYPAATEEDVAAGRLTPGMPMLVKERSGRIDGQLAASELEGKFGHSLRDHYLRMQKRYSGKMAEARARAGKPAEVIDLKAFRRHFAQAAPAAPVVAKPTPAVERRAPVRRTGTDFSIRHDVGDDGRERLTVIDRRSGEERALSDGGLASGRYPKEDSFGLPSGFLVIDADGGYSHLDMEERHHNALGPAIVPARGAGPPRFAVEGNFVPAPIGHAHSASQPEPEMQPAAEYSHEPRFKPAPRRV